jgi:hypothetical protein
MKLVKTIPRLGSYPELQTYRCERCHNVENIEVSGFSQGGSHDNADQWPETQWLSPQRSRANYGDGNSACHNPANGLALRVLTSEKADRIFHRLIV